MIMKLINIIRKYRLVLLIIFGLSAISPVFAQVVITDPIAIKITENGQELEKPETIHPGVDLISGSAPMRIEFKAQVTAPENIQWHCEWDFSKSEEFESNYIMPRYEDDTDYNFTESGRYYVRLLVSYTDNEGNNIELPASESFVINISESDLKIPNAFSPNGDGINDIFKVTYKSLIRFNAYVFNRWGQQLYSWGLNNIDEGWDGTFNGKAVKDGVYFIVIEAEGSDGRQYKHKGDINILRGFSGTGSVPSPEN